MVKKKVKKRTKRKPAKKRKIVGKRTISRPRITQTSSEVQVEKMLIENFVAMQKVMSELSVKFESLSTKLARLLDLFEMSAKELARKEFHVQPPQDNEIILKKLEEISGQNKVIAKGVTLFHESPELKNFSHTKNFPRGNAPNLSHVNSFAPYQPSTVEPEGGQAFDTSGYQRSISTNIVEEESAPEETNISQ